MKYKCEMIRDLMPLCIDNEASNDSLQAVTAHMAECKSCEDYYRLMRKEVITDGVTDTKTTEYLILAQKIRKRNMFKRLALAFTCSMFLWLCVNYAEGYRYQAEAAAETDLNLNYSSVLLSKYVWNDRHFFIYDCSTYFETATVHKTWRGWRLSPSTLVWPKNYNHSEIEIAGKLYFRTDTNNKTGIQLFPVISHDEKVTKLEVSAFGITKKVDIVRDKIEVISFDNPNESLAGSITGKAYDAQGNVLYELTEGKQFLEWIRTN